MLEIDQFLLHEDLITGLHNDVLVSAPLFNHALEIDDYGLAILVRELDLPFVSKIAKAAGADDRLADGILFVRRDLLRTGTLDRANDVNLSARFLAYVIDRNDHRRVVVILLLERGFDVVGELLRGASR